MSDCCEAWRAAQHRGTDCEAYGASLHEGGRSGWLICGVRHRVRFCPWCGVRKAEQDGQPLPATPDMAARIEAREEDLRVVVELADAGLIDEACDHARAALNGKDEQ